MPGEIPPSLLRHLGKIEDLLSRRPFGLIVDIDGTIAPIAPSPELASVTPACRRYLRKLSKLLPLVAAVSGRPAREARRLVGIPSMIFVGNHGLDRWERGRVITDPSIDQYRKPIKETLAHLRLALDVPGVIVEDKGATLSVHYRLAADPEVARWLILREVMALATAKGLRVTEGRMVVEIRPPVDVDKGSAVMKLVVDYGLRSALYVGDDDTDLDAFRALRAWQHQGAGVALSVAVMNPESGERLAEEADAYVYGVGEVARFLGWLSKELSRPV